MHGVLANRIRISCHVTSMYEVAILYKYVILTLIEIKNQWKQAHVRLQHQSNKFKEVPWQISIFDSLFFWRHFLSFYFFFFCIFMWFNWQFIHTCSNNSSYIAQNVLMSTRHGMCVKLNRFFFSVKKSARGISSKKKITYMNKFYWFVIIE